MDFSTSIKKLDLYEILANKNILKVLSLPICENEMDFHLFILFINVIILMGDIFTSWMSLFLSTLFIFDVGLFY